MKVKRDLFECPGYSPVDGSAHILGDRGFLFLFPGGFDKKIAPEKTMRASISLNRRIGLKEDRAANYQITEVHPNAGADRGTFRYGEDFLYDMPKDSAAILSIAPITTEPKPQRATLKADSEVIVVKAFAPIEN